MKKIYLVSICSFLFLAISSVVAYCLRFIPYDNAVTYLSIGIGILVMSGITAFIVKKNFKVNLVCLSFNAVALGFCIRAWYIFRGFDNPLWLMLLVCVACLVYLWLFYLTLYIPYIEKHVNVYVWIYVAISLTVYILLVIFTKTTYLSTLGYYMILQISFMFALCHNSVTAEKFIRDLTASSFSVFAIATIILILMSEADVSDCLTLDGSSIIDSSPKNKTVTINKKI